MWEQIQQALSVSTTRVLSQVASLLPGIAALVLAVLVSAVLAIILAGILRRSLKGIEFDEKVGRWGFTSLAEWSPRNSPTLLVARVTAGMVILVGFLIGVSAFDLTLTSTLVARLFEYLPNVLVAIIVLLVGSLVARFLARSVLIGAVNLNLQYARLLSAGVHWMVMVLAVAMALDHLSIAGGIIRLAFGILFGGIVFALALAVGLGSKDLVSRSLEREASRPKIPADQEPVRHL
jgi:mechanosensitive ion channel-like protein